MITPTKPKPALMPTYGEKVELVGGPLCGDTIMWVGGQNTVKLPYHGGSAIYCYEGEGKAVYVKG